MQPITYKDSGVNIDVGNEVVARIKKLVKCTYSNNVLSNIGGFAGMINLKEILQPYQNPVLVQSIDGVGTKTVIAKLLHKYDTLGIDLVSANCNDILVVGAKPLTMLDYIASDRLDPDIIEDLVRGMANACQENNVSLIGGETAEMPKVYFSGEHDLAAVVTGIVEKDKIINGKDIKIGDIIFGFTSSGLHTNGYSLARKLLLEVAGYNITQIIPEINTERSLGEVLLSTHINYTNPILELLDAGIKIHGMAHITGGGLLENIPRILPHNCNAQINLPTWEIPPIFNALKKVGNLPTEEMFRTFNMGIGYILIAPASETSAVHAIANKYHKIFKTFLIGKVVAGNGVVDLIDIKK